MNPKLLYASTKDSDMRYVVGIDVSDPFFVLVVGNTQYIFLDSREFGIFAEKNTDSSKQLILLDPLIKRARENSDKVALAAKIGLLILSEYNLTHEIISVSGQFPIFLADYLRSKNVKLNPVESLFPQRLQKASNQVAMLRESLVRTQAAFKRIEAILSEGVIVGDVILYKDKPITSELLRSEAEQVLLAEDMISSEGIIVSCGPHAAIPHHPGSGAIRPYQTIVCDIFPKHRATGYFADMTRTYVKGQPSMAIQDLYRAVLDAQIMAIELVKPGAVMQDLQSKVEQLFLDRGYHVGDTGFTHGLGHGLGLDVHEQPFFRKGHQTILEPGHVITIEPGLYYPDIGGVRIEDVVLVTPRGNTNLTDYHKDYVIL